MQLRLMMVLSAAVFAVSRWGLNPEPAVSAGHYFSTASSIALSNGSVASLAFFIAGVGTSACI